MSKKLIYLIKLVSLIMIAWSLSGCFSPQYQVVEHFEIPEAKQDCSKNCQKSKERCRDWARHTYEQCIQTKIDKQMSDRANNIRGRTRSEYPQITCGNLSDLEAICQRDYRACYELCGGQIKTERICVAHCSQ